jgi:hypothetical protein
MKIFKITKIENTVIKMVKEHNIVVRVDKATKDFFKKMADARGLSVTDLILRLISEGKKFENKRSEGIQRLASSIRYQ